MASSPPPRGRIVSGCCGNVVKARKILSPGIGAQGGDPDRVAGLVDGIIIGRAIYEAEDPASC